MYLYNRVIFCYFQVQPNSETKNEDCDNSTKEKEDASEKECANDHKANNISADENKKATITP